MATKENNTSSAPTESGANDQPILEAYQEWAAAYDVLARAESEADNNAAYAVLSDAEAKVLSFAPVTARGLAIQVTVFTSFYEFGALADKRFDMEAHLEAIASVNRPASFPGGEALVLEEVA